MTYDTKSYELAELWINDSQIPLNAQAKQKWKEELAKQIQCAIEMFFERCIQPHELEAKQ